MPADWPTYFGGEKTWVYAVPKPAEKMPEPEVRARPATAEDVPQSVQSFVKKYRKAGWQLRMTYARGPELNKAGLKVLATADTIGVIFADGRQPKAQGIWKRRDPKTVVTVEDDEVSVELETELEDDGKWKFWFGFVCQDGKIRRVNMVGLRAFLNDNVPF